MRMGEGSKDGARWMISPGRTWSARGDVTAGGAMSRSARHVSCRRRAYVAETLVLRLRLRWMAQPSARASRSRGCERWRRVCMSARLTPRRPGCQGAGTGDWGGEHAGGGAAHMSAPVGGRGCVYARRRYGTMGMDRGRAEWVRDVFELVGWR